MVRGFFLLKERINDNSLIMTGVLTGSPGSTSPWSHGSEVIDHSRRINYAR